ncbi:hypothetical protein U9M48_039097 [Paspalum notatum var. saurae]|uniref:DUF4408 domain-containing protein n=1 Tax=Paspalum notatum var. saurae TaxID=547442 RepID=A0AAQ3XCT6_PASNO
MALLTLPWWPLSPWLSPAAAWFIFFNAVVSAIAIMSSSSSSTSSAQTAPSRRRLCRSGSSVLLDRLRSLCIFCVHPAAGGAIAGAGALPFDDAGGSDASGSHCYYCCSQSRQVDGAHDTQTDQLPRRSPMPVAADAATGGGTETSAPVAMEKAEDDHGAPAPAPADDQEVKAEAEPVLQDDSIGLDEAYALAQRHRAAEPPPPPPTATAPTPSSARRTKKKPAAAAKVAETGVRRRTRGCGGAEAGDALLEGKAELNARAELFIRQFREDLKLQRLNSILRHTQALGSPTAAAR